MFTNADLYESLAEVDNHLKAFFDAKREDPGKMEVLRPMIWEAVADASLDRDLEITEAQAFEDFDAFLEKLHDYLGEISDTMINDGLHTLGLVPEGERLTEFLVQLTRVANGQIPSLREALVTALGHDYDHLLENRGRVVDPKTGMTGKALIEQAHTLALKLVGAMGEAGFESDPDHLKAVVADFITVPDPDTLAVLAYLAGSVVPNIRKTTEELDATLTALDGGFVKPGPSGAPTRGQADILPTGRNFYSVDPGKIPTPAAWEVGKRLGDALLQRYQNETSGPIPEVWASSSTAAPPCAPAGTILQKSSISWASSLSGTPPTAWSRALRLSPKRTWDGPGSMCCPGFPDSSGTASPCWCNGSTRPWPWWPPWMSPWTPI